ncbi:GntR family transcriptional regulator [Streptomyces sp. NPDC051940]|uniref:GntR family transcriptional regulator n=1 Tax=Streptomyces sp. NPDC051940 TaxID=3155675 RepID=UPI0034125B5D
MSTGDAGSLGRAAARSRAGDRVPEQRTAGDGAGRPAAPLGRGSVRGQILAELRAALADGRLRPGDVYSAPSLAAPLGVSPTPVREAMQILAAEGAVEVLPNRGFRIVPPPVGRHVAEVRVLLVVPVVLGSAHDLPALRLLARSPGEEADRAFHEALLAPAANPELLRVAADLHTRAGLPASSPQARLALLDALAAGDTALATERLRALLGA